MRDVLDLPGPGGEGDPGHPETPPEAWVPLGISARKAELTVDAHLVASRLGLPVDTFRQLMDAGRIATLCERGVGEDRGLFRATFYNAGQRVRLVLDASSRIVSME